MEWRKEKSVSCEITDHRGFYFLLTEGEGEEGEREGREKRRLESVCCVCVGLSSAKLSSPLRCGSFGQSAVGDYTSSA